MSSREPRSPRGTTELTLMKGIERYNEVDGRVMAEALTWLRANR